MTTREELELAKKKILEENGFFKDFPDSVIWEVIDVAQEPNKEDLVGRIDLRDLDFFTIDPVTAKDYDDAIFWAKEKEDTRLYVSIIDVSYHIAPYSDLETETLRRGNSLYIPNEVVPMLDFRLSNNICSLIPNKDRLTLTCEMLISPKGEVKEMNFYESVIHSKNRYTYQEINEQIGRDAFWTHIANTTQEWRKERMKKGSLNVHTEEITIDGETMYIQGHGLAEQLIEECMLMANKTIAERVAGMDLPFIYRVHEEPDVKKLRQFYDLLSSFNGKTYKTVRSDAYYIGTEMASCSQWCHGVLNNLLLRSMKKAYYSIDADKGHYGLGFDKYSHFTSPARRIDWLNHRLLKKYLIHGDYNLNGLDVYLETIATQISEREVQTMKVERKITEMEVAFYMQDHLQDKFMGIVSDVQDFGLFVKLPNGADVCVYVSELGKGKWKRQGHSFTDGKTVIRLGQKLPIIIDEVDVLNGKVFGVRDRWS